MSDSFKFKIYVLSSVACLCCWNCLCMWLLYIYIGYKHIWCLQICTIFKIAFPFNSIRKGSVRDASILLCFQICIVGHLQFVCLSLLCKWNNRMQFSMTYYSGLPLWGTRVLKWAPFLYFFFFSFVSTNCNIPIGFAKHAHLRLSSLVAIIVFAQTTVW